jgi:hypothetical protein
MKDAITLLNTSILTSYGSFTYESMSLKEARFRVHEATELANGPTIQSAIGHEATAVILSKLLGIPVSVNRIQYKQEVGEQAIVFKLLGRPPEGKVLSEAEMEAVGYEFGLLERTA